jgi:hypothetical protein
MAVLLELYSNCRFLWKPYLCSFISKNIGVSIGGVPIHTVGIRCTYYSYSDSFSICKVGKSSDANVWYNLRIVFFTIV